MSEPMSIIPTGDEYLDTLRAQVFQQPTDIGNFRERALALKLWVATLQQIGVNLEAYLPLEEVLAAHKFHAYQYTTDPS